MWVGNDAAGGNEEDMKAWMNFEQDAKRASVFVTGTALQPAKQTSKLVKPELAKPSKNEEVRDGTFTAGSEQIEAFYILDCKNEEEALMWARKLPTRGTVEVRPYLEYSLS